LFDRERDAKKPVSVLMQGKQADPKPRLDLVEMLAELVFFVLSHSLSD
jgi:hypothetical protein